MKMNNNWAYTILLIVKVILLLSIAGILYLIINIDRLSPFLISPFISTVLYCIIIVILLIIATIITLVYGFILDDYVQSITGRLPILKVDKALDTFILLGIIGVYVFGLPRQAVIFFGILIAFIVGWLYTPDKEKVK